MRQFKGIIKFPFLKRLINSRDYRNHTVEDGKYTLYMVKNKFECIPKSVKYYSVYLVR